MAKQNVNLYLTLELFLDPAITDFRKLKEEVKKKVNTWRRDPKQHQHKLEIAEAFLSSSTAPGPDEGGMLDYQARFAREQREKEGREKAAAYETDGTLEQVEVDELIKEFSRYFQEDTIRSWFTLSVDDDEEFVFTPPEEPKYPVPPLSDKNMRRIGADLKIVLDDEDKTLYDLIGSSAFTDRQFLQEKAKAEYDEAQHDARKGTAAVDARIRLLGEAMSTFKDADSQQSYDIALSQRPFYKLVERRFKGRALKGWISVTDYKTSISEVRATEIPEKEAEWLVFNYYCNIRDCPHPKRTNDEERARAQRMAKKAQEDAEKAIGEAKEDAANRIAEAKKEAQDKSDAAGRRADENIKAAQDRAQRMIAEFDAEAKAEVQSARQRAEQHVADADRRIADAAQRRTAAEQMQKEAEEIAANAIRVARQEVVDEKNAATAEKIKAQQDQQAAQEEKETARLAKEWSLKNVADTKAEAAKEVADAEAQKLNAENIRDQKIAEANRANSSADDARHARNLAYLRLGRTIFASASLVIVILTLSVIGLFVSTAAMSSAKIDAATASSELTKYKADFDTKVAEERKRVDAAVAQAETKEAEAVAKFNSADLDHKKAREAQVKADAAQAKAVADQQRADATLAEALKERAVAEKDRNIAIENNTQAKQREDNALALKQEADNTMAKAEGMMSDAKTMVADAQRSEAVAKENAAKEAERRKGVEAMIEAGAPMRFPLEPGEEKEQVQQQDNLPSPPVAQAATPLAQYGHPNVPSNSNKTTRSTKEIFSEVTWRWCLEGELGIEKGLKWIGEVTGKPRSGYRTHEQGDLVPKPKYEPAYYAELKFGGKDKQDDRVIMAGMTFPMKYNVAPKHFTQFDRRYMLAQIPVTQELWESVMGGNPSQFQGANRPVENVSWDDCQVFITKLNGMKTELGVPVDYEFTLPRESEWEHACRAGTSENYAFGSALENRSAKFNGARRFWSDENKLYYSGTSAAGMYPGNAWGLQDMHGNVWEWCQDAVGYGPLEMSREYANGNPYAEDRLPNIVDNFYSKSKSIDGLYRTLRGGGWTSFAEQCGSAYRNFGNPGVKHNDTGLRLCLAAGGKGE